MLVALVLAATLNGFVPKETTNRADWYARKGWFHNVDAKACEGFVKETETVLGVKLPRFEYYRVSTPEDVAELKVDRRPSGGFAHQEPPYAVATEPCSKHEMAHLLTFQLGRSTPVFEEGLAAMLAKDHPWWHRNNNRWDGRHYHVTYDRINAVFTNRRNAVFRDRYDKSDPVLEYRMADSFVRHLIKDHGGMEKILAFMRDCPKSPENDDVFAATNKAFIRHYGISPAAEFERWLQGEPKEKK